MGLLLADGPAAADLRQQQEEALLHKQGCKICPLQTQPGRMAATGADDPLIYVIGEAPGAEEIKDGRQFIGESGQLLRPRLPRRFRSLIRWNNVVRSRPPKNRTPVWKEIECCRPSVIADIEASKPKVVFGFGNVPLHWATGQSTISNWRGRRTPVKIGNHVCWYYAFTHPSYLLRIRRGHDLEPTDIGSEEERMFVLDLKRAFAEVDDLVPAVIHTPEQVAEGVEILNEFGPAGLQKIESWLTDAARQPEVGIDYETDALRPYEANCRLLSVAISWGDRTFAFGIDHPQCKWTPRERERIIELLARFLEHAPCVKIVHNLAFEMEWTDVKVKHGILRSSRWEDTASAAAIIDERRGPQKPGCFSLEFLCQLYFGFNLKKLSGIDRKRLAKIALPRVLNYNAWDAKYHLLLWRVQKQIIEQQGLQEPYRLAVRRVPTVVYTQVKGVPVDQVAVEELRVKYGDKAEKIEQEIRSERLAVKFTRQFGYPLNPMSNPDALKLFHDMLGREECETIDKFTKKTRLSVDENVLDIIAKDEPIAELIVALRKANKSKSTYLDPLSLKTESSVVYPDGLVHAQFNTIFAETGRLSCDSPNLQNFPKRDAEAREVRRCIRAPDGHVILAFDYGQIEARVIAMFTHDARFCKALWERYDVHMEWAERIAYAYPARIGGKEYLKDKKAMKDFRTDIKNQWTFPLFFGASDRSAAGYLDIPIQIIKPLYNEFWEQFSGVLDWQEKQLAFYHEHGYVECLTGRRRRGPFSVNQVYNTPIQGTAAEIVMDAMCRISELEVDELQPEINIHDDLTFLRVHPDKVDDIAERVVGEMLSVPFPWVNVPISVEMAVGTDWQRMTDQGSFFSDKWFT